MQLDFHELLQPYRKAKPQLTLEMIFNTMVNHYKFPSAVVGEAVWKTFDEMANGLTFTGDGTTRVEALTYYMRDRCREMASKKAVYDVEKAIDTLTACGVYNCCSRVQKIRKRSFRHKFLRFWLKPRLFWRL